MAQKYDRDELVARLVRAGELHKLNPNEFPGCYLYRSDPNDVRVSST